MPLLVNNLQEKIQVDELMTALVNKAVEETLAVENFEQDPEVSLVLVDDAYIQEMNRTYRGLDKPTDVLSFPMLEETAEEPDLELPEEEVLLGDIIISMERAVLQAEEYGHTLARELAFLTVHGMLHLLGYDHEEEAQRVVMRKQEETILARLKLGR